MSSKVIPSKRDRTDKTVKKDILTKQKNNVERVFNKYKSVNSFMGVYFTDLEMAFITFNIDGVFPDYITIGKHKHMLGYVYDTAKAPQSQTTQFLSV